MESADLAGAPLPQVQTVLPASMCITWQSMEIVEWNAQSCEVLQNQFVASCEREWINPLTVRCNEIHKAFLEEHAQLEQTFLRQATEWESLRTTLANRVRELESTTKKSCDTLGGEVHSLLSKCNPLPQIVDEHTEQVVALFQRTVDLQGHLGVLRTNHAQECSQIDTHVKNLWSFVDGFRQKNGDPGGTISPMGGCQWSSSKLSGAAFIPSTSPGKV